MSYLRYLCLFGHSGIQHILCCVFYLFSLVLCTICYQFLWIVPFWLTLRYSRIQYIIQNYKNSTKVILYTNITSFFRFVDKRAIYWLGIIPLAHAPVLHTHFPSPLPPPPEKWGYGEISSRKNECMLNFSPGKPSMC